MKTRRPIVAKINVTLYDCMYISEHTIHIYRINIYIYIHVYAYASTAYIYKFVHIYIYSYKKYTRHLQYLCNVSTEVSTTFYN